LKQFLAMKALIALAGVVLFLYGISVVDTDPKLRVLQDVTMAQLEAGDMPREGQYVRITDARLLPVWVTVHSHSRKRGDHATVHAGLGSERTFETGVNGKPAQVAVWVTLKEDFHTKESASTAMNREELYRAPSARTGVFSALPESVRENANNGVWQSSASFRLEEGEVPSTKGHGIGMVGAGVLLVLLVAGWLVADHFADRWRAGLIPAGSAPAQMFAGAAPWLLLFALGVLVAPVLMYLCLTDWVDEGRFDTPLVLGLLATLAVAAFALSRNRLALIVNDKGLARAGRKGVERLVSWDEVDGVSIQQRSGNGITQSTQSLHIGKRTVKAGSGFFQGGVHDHKAFGEAVREKISRRLAPKLIARLDAGERVSFGPIGACRDGLIKGSKLESGEMLPWAELASAEFAKGKLKIKRKGKLLAWDSVAVSKVRNLDLLVMLINQPARPA
jgi:hypothetical protein